MAPSSPSEQDSDVRHALPVGVRAQPRRSELLDDLDAVLVWMLCYIELSVDKQHERGLLASVASFMGLAAAHDGLTRWFSGHDATGEARFERLMGELKPLVSFGRTGSFDLLVLLGNLGVYALAPPRLYLAGATGPKDGARRILPGTRGLRELDDELSAAAHRLGVEIQAMEDALCNWQKVD
jgi:Alpha-glutamyl/putrescinyl thymine pyrophosphorylase clade 3